jgi:hypothetical protein
MVAPASNRALRRAQSAEDKAKLKRLMGRGKKLAANKRAEALCDLADRVAQHAMRRGGYLVEQSRFIAEFFAWGVFVRDLKAAIDAAATGKAIRLPEPPPLPADADADLRPALRHFAGLAGVPVPESWGDSP